MKKGRQKHDIHMDQTMACRCACDSDALRYLSAEARIRIQFHRYLRPLGGVVHQQAVNLGLFSGTTPRTFSPDANMTRAMFVTVLAKYSKEDIQQYTTSQFRDVPADAWYAHAVAWAYSGGIISGTSKNQFSPESKWRLSLFDLQIISVLLSRVFAAAKPFRIKVGRQIILSMPHIPCIVPVLSTVLLPKRFRRPEKRRARSVP